MREIEVELDPTEYRFQHPKTGRWHRKMSRRWYRNWMLVCIGGVAYVFFNLPVLTPWSTFCGTLAFAIPGGIMFAGWLQDVY
jgi:uncharacterized membrane protein